MTDQDIQEEQSLAPAEPQEPPAGELSAAQLEALLFVAERPLTRREIATLAGVTVDDVNALLGDLEVSLRERGIRLVASGDHVQLVLTHRGLGTNLPEIGQTAAGWHTHLSVLTAHLASMPLPPFWPSVARWEKEYGQRVLAVQG